MTENLILTRLLPDSNPNKSSKNSFFPVIFIVSFSKTHLVHCKRTGPKSGVPSDVHIEPATIEDLTSLTELVVDLLDLQDDFTSDPSLQEKGIRHILEEPARGRIFVARTQDRIVGMANLLFTVSTAMGGFVLIMEDVIIHPDHRGQGYGALLLEAVIDFAREKDFKRITLLDDKLSNDSQTFFQQHGFQYSSLIPMRLILNPANS